MISSECRLKRKNTQDLHSLMCNNRDLLISHISDLRKNNLSYRSPSQHSFSDESSALASKKFNMIQDRAMDHLKDS